MFNFVSDLKSAVRIFLLALTTSIVLSNACIKTGVYVWFITNRTVIEHELCEKKEIANNCCKGSCVLEKKMEETGDHSSRDAAPSFKKLPDLSAFAQADALELEFIIMNSKTNYPGILSPETKGMSPSFFHPPAC